jgi:hypothetical protein
MSISGRKIAAAAEAVPVLGEREQSITTTRLIEQCGRSGQDGDPVHVAGAACALDRIMRSRRPGRGRQLVALRLERGDPPRAAAAEVSETRRTGRNGSSRAPEADARCSL